MSKSALTVLREARELISDPKRWTRAELARDATQHGVRANSVGATCWCALGAVLKVTDTKLAYQVWDFPATKVLMRAAKSEFGPYDIPAVNDLLGHEATIRMFDAAIASAEKEAGNAVQA